MFTNNPFLMLLAPIEYQMRRTSSSKNNEIPKVTTMMCPKRHKDLLNKITNGSIGSILNLSKQNLSDDQLIGILNALTLSNNHITEINLSGNLLSNNSLNGLILFIKSNKNLGTINLFGNLIDDEGAKTLFAEVKNNVTIISLNLFGNLIENDHLLEIVFKKIIDRNIQVKNEIEQFSKYITLAAIDRILSLPDLVTDIILDNCIDATIPGARQYVKNILYPQAVETVYNLSDIEALELVKEKFPHIYRDQSISRKLRCVQQDLNFLDQNLPRDFSGVDKNIKVLSFSKTKESAVLSNHKKEQVEKLSPGKLASLMM